MGGGGICPAANSPFLNPWGSGISQHSLQPERRRASVVSIPGRAGDHHTREPLLQPSKRSQAFWTSGSITHQYLHSFTSGFKDDPKSKSMSLCNKLGCFSPKSLKQRAVIFSYSRYSKTCLWHEASGDIFVFYLEYCGACATKGWANSPVLSQKAAGINDSSIVWIPAAFVRGVSGVTQRSWWKAEQESEPSLFEGHLSKHAEKPDLRGFFGTRLSGVFGVYLSLREMLLFPPFSASCRWSENT